jgi:hypothetical protein
MKAKRGNSMVIINLKSYNLDYFYILLPYMRFKRTNISQIPIIIVAALIIGIFSTVTYEFSNGQEGNLFTTDSHPFGITYGDWTAKWWQWALSIPQDVNPVGDPTGRYCGQNQNGPVWFLAGTFGGSAERTCTIPEGKAVLFAPVNVECSYAEFPDLKSETDLRECAKSGQDLVTELDVTVDGVKLQGLKEFRVQSPLFNLTLPKNNVFGLPGASTEAVSDGNWVFLKPLPPGNHTIHSKGVSVDFTTTGTSPAFVSDVIYHINVS